MSSLGWAQVTSRFYDFHRFLGRLEEAFTLFLDEAAEGERRPIGQALQRGCISRLARQLPGSGRGRAEGGDMICHDGVHHSARVRFSERQQLVPPGLARDGHEADWPRELLAQHARHLGVAEQLGAWRILDHAALETLGVQRSEEHTSELQSLAYLVCRLLLEKKKKK